MKKSMSLLVASILSSRMQSLPVYSTSHCFDPALEYRYDSPTENIKSEYDKYNDRRTSTVKTHHSYPIRRHRRSLGRSRSVGTYSRTLYHPITYEGHCSNPKSQGPSCNTDHISQNVKQGVCFSGKTDTYGTQEYETYKPYKSSKPRVHKSSIKRKVQIRPTASCEQYDENYHQFNETNVKQKRSLNVNNIKVYHLRTLPDTLINNTPDERLSVTPYDSDTLLNDSYSHHYHGYASDDSIPETAIHVFNNKQKSLDLEPYIVHQGVTTSPRVDDSNKSFHSCPFIKDIDKKTYLSLDLRSKCENKQQFESREYKDISNKYNLDHVRRNQKNCKFFKINKSHSESVLSICSSSAQYKCITPDENITILNTVTSLSKQNTVSEKMFTKDPKYHGNLKPYTPRCMPSNNHAFDPSFRVAKSYRLVQDYSKMANSLSVGLSPTNLGSPCGLLTSVAPHLPPDDTHHKTTEATTYPPDDAVSTQPEHTTAAHRAPNWECDDANDEKTCTTLKNNDDPDDLKTSNDYGGRENGRNHGQQQTLERRESRRGQFTRSLSNTDAPDEKAGMPSFRRLYS